MLIVYDIGPHMLTHLHFSRQSSHWNICYYQDLHPWPFWTLSQNLVPPVNIPIPTKIGSKMGGAPTPKWDPFGFDPQPIWTLRRCTSMASFWFQRLARLCLAVAQQGAALPALVALAQVFGAEAPQEVASNRAPFWGSGKPANMD